MPVLKVPTHLYSHQRAFLEKVFADREPKAGRPTSRWYVVKAFRQSAGKTHCLENLIILVAVTSPDSVSLFLEPTNSQCSKVAEETWKACRSLGARLSTQTNTIRFPNGSMILFKSGESDPTVIRGYTVKRGGTLVVDEAGFIKEEYFNTLFPVVQKHKAQVILASTPDMQSGTFYEMYMRGLDKSQNKVTSFNWSEYVHEMFTEEELEFYRSIYSTRRFTTEVLGEFPSSDGQVFKKIDKAIRPLEHGEEVDLVSIDWGSGQGKDYTAIVRWNREKEVIGIDCWNELSPVEQIEKLRDLILNWRPRKVLVEQNSIGQIYLDMLKKEVGRYVRVDGFQTNNNSKNRIIDNLSAAFEHERIRLPENDELKHELAVYEEQVTKTGLRTYNAQKGSHDDIVMALAIGWDELDKSAHYSFSVYSNYRR